MSFPLEIDIKAPVSVPEGILDPYRLEFGRSFVPLRLSSIYQNGTWQKPCIEPLDQIRLHPAALVLHYGQAVFEGLKAYKWKDGSIRLFRPDENARRLNRSAARMAMPVIEEEAFLKCTRALIGQQKAWIPDFPGSLYIRPTMIATEPCIGVRSAHDFLFFIITMPSGAYFPQTVGQSGTGSVKVYVTSDIGRAARGGTGHVKAAANYAVTVQIIDEAKRKGCPQVLFLDACGNRRVEEMGGMNVFFVAGQKLLTPKLNGTILPGITRDSIIKIAPSLGFEPEECEISFDDLITKIKQGTVTEAFACGTAAVVVGIDHFLLDTGEDIKVGEASPGPVTSALYDRLTGIQYGKYPDPFGWVFEV